MRFGTRDRGWRLVPPRRHWECGAMLLGLLGCTGCLHNPDAMAPGAAPAAAVRYTATIENAPSEAVAELAERSLPTFRLRERGARNRANLLGRVRRDEDRLARLLRSQGYYTPAVTAQVAVPSDDTASVRFVVRAGPAYTLTDHVLAFDPPATDHLPKLDALALGSPVGATARAAAIVQAEEAAVAALHRAGYPYAAFVGREGVADPDTATVTVTSTLTAGPYAVFGPVRFTGLAKVSEPYLSTYRSWDERSPLDRRALDTYQQRLMATQLFRAVAVRIPDEAPSGGDDPVALPVVVTLEEGPRRRVEAGVRFDTDLGLSGHTGWRHRNLFGANESLQVEVEAGRVKQGAAMDFRRPQFRRPGQSLTASLGAVRTDDHAFDARTVTGSAGLTRRFAPRWTLGFGGLAEASTIDEPEGEVRAYLVGAPISATFDHTDRALDPTTGERLEIEAVPFAGELAGAVTRFGMIGARGSIYRPLDRDARYVAAARGRAATVIAENLASVPATRRLYAGGGGSVRGYAKSSIGPLDPDGTPSGGRSVLEAEAELRARVGDDFGVVLFVAAGLVSAAAVPASSDDVQAAAGMGVRYFSPAGPIRLDLAAPLNARAGDDPVAVYVSIGQAF
ncbi:MAG: BamA/TamA family outer membrane protein [Rhodospirillales bacterium]|nr:BamA/TamA family outer membrane protein [Rhodospirillales bacterium]